MGASLAERLDAELKAAMRARDQARTTVLRSLKAALRNAAIERGGASSELDEATALAVVRKQVRQREDSVESFARAGREDLAERERAEIVTLSEFLPAAPDADEVRRLVAEAIARTGATGKARMGEVMKELRERVGGAVDGKTLSDEVRAQLG